MSDSTNFTTLPLRIPPREPSYNANDSQTSFLTEQDVRAHLACCCKGRTQKTVAEELGVSPQYLSEILRGRREVSAQIARKIGLVRCVLFEHPAQEAE